MAIINNDPIGEDRANIDYADQIAAQLSAMNYFRSALLEADRDKSKQYNTFLAPEEEEKYQSWKRLASPIYGDIDESDYDFRGLYRETLGAVPDSVYKPATYRKPNNIEFTTDSIYHGRDGYQGGTYTQDGKFMVGSTTFYSDDELENFYTNKNITVDKSKELTQTERLRQALRDEDYDFSYVKSDIDAYQQAEKLGKKTIGEVIKESFDPAGDNVFGRIAGTTVGGAIGASLAAGLLGSNPVGWAGALLMAGGAALGATAGDGLAIWGSNKDERDIEEKMLRLQADDYDDPAERELAEQDVASWYNELNIERYREQGWGANVADIFLESLPYMSSFFVPGKALAVGGQKVLDNVTGKLVNIFNRTTKTGKRADPGFKAALKSGDFSKLELDEYPLQITKEQSKEILRAVRKDTSFAKGDSRAKAYRKGMEKAYNDNLQKVLKSKPVRLGISGAGTQVIQQPAIFDDLAQERLESFSVDDKGNFTFDETGMSDLAIKQASAYLAILVETVGFEYASKLVKATGIQNALKPAVESVVNSKAVKAIGRPGIRKGLDNFFNNNLLGKSLTGKTALMKDIAQKVQFGGVLEEASEEYIEMVASATLGLDKEQREQQGFSYAENLLDKVLFPVKYPAEASAILAAVAILPTAAAGVSAVRGDKLKEEYEKELGIIEKLLDLQKSGQFITAEELNKAVEDAEIFAGTVFNQEKNKKWFQRGLIGKVLQAGRHNDILVADGFGFKDSLDMVETIENRATQLVEESKDVNAPISELAARKKAISEIVSESIVVKLAVEAEGVTEKQARNILEELRKNNDIKPFKIQGEKGQFITGIGVKQTGPRKTVVQKFQISSKRRKELEKDPTIKKVLDSQGIITRGQTEASDAALSERTSLDTSEVDKLSTMINNKNTSPQVIKEQRNIAINSVKSQLNLTFGTTPATGGKGAIRTFDKRVENIVDQLASEKSDNPDLKVSIAPATVVEKMDEFGGRKFKDKTGVAVIQGTNLDNEIILSDLSTFDPQTDLIGTGARVVEEEALEVNYKASRGTKLNTFTNQLIGLTKNEAKNIIKSEESTEEEKIKAKITLGVLNNLSPFEAFINLTQAAYGDQSRFVDPNLSTAVEFIKSNSNLSSLLDQSVLTSFSGNRLAKLSSNMNPQSLQLAESLIQESTSKGRTAVEKFLETQPSKPLKKTKTGKTFPSRKIKKAKQEAIGEVKGQIVSGKLSEEQKVLAKKVLTVLEKEYDDPSGIETKRKAQIRKIHNQKRFQDVTYSVVTGEQSDGDQNLDPKKRKEENTGKDNTDLNFVSTYSDEFYDDKISNAIISERGSREGKAVIKNVRDSKWLDEALESEKAWNNFKSKTHRDSVKDLFKRIGENYTYKQVKRFQRLNKSNHIYRFFSVDLKGKIQFKNSIDMLVELVTNVNDNNDNVDYRKESYEQLKKILTSEPTAEIVDELFSLLEEWTGISSEKLKDINQTFDNKIVSRMFEIDPNDLTDRKTSIIKNAIIKGADPGPGKSKSFGDQNSISRFIMESDLGSFRNSPMFTSVTGKQKAASRGDSHINFAAQEIFKMLGLNEEQIKNISYRYIMFLDGTGEAKTKHTEPENLRETQVIKIIKNVFNESANPPKDSLLRGLHKAAGQKVYYHQMGRFGEKGSMPFVLQKYYGNNKKDLLKEAKRAKARLDSFKSKDARDMFIDPVALVESFKNETVSKDEEVDAHYAINTINLMYAMHGDPSVYVMSESKKEGKSKDQIVAYNFLNLVARASQILTDGVAYRGPLKLIKIEDIPGFSNADIDAFDGQALLSDKKLKEIAEDLVIEDTDTLKAHISNVTNGKRVLVKVNWTNVELARETSPIMEKLAKYINQHDIDGVVFPSGAKYMDIETTDWQNDEVPKVLEFPEGNNLIVSQDLHHDNQATHEGFIPSQRVAHFAALNEDISFIINGSLRTINSPGLTAFDLRTEASEINLQQHKKKPKKIELGATANPDIIRAKANGEDVENDPRFISSLISSKLSAVKNLIRHSGKRTALQTLGEGDLKLAGYEEVVDANGNRIIKLARINANIRGVRYQSKGFKSKEKAIEHIKNNPLLYADMFYANEDGNPDFENVLEHEIDEIDGKFIIPGEIVERTRVPSGAYASHSFNRVMQPASKTYKTANIAVANDSVRIGMGEDLDGDKGFTLVLDRQFTEDGKIEFLFEIEADPKTPELTASSLNNRALMLEHMAWIHPDYFGHYNVKGDIPKDSFDKAINRSANEKLKDFKFGSVKGLGLASEVNYTRAKVIGTTAVYNTMFSALSLDTSSEKILTTDNPRKAYEREKYYVESPTSIDFTSYKTIKRLLDIVLNIALDDHKDPRLFFANITPETASIFATLVMTNVKKMNLGSENSTVKNTKAAKKVEEIIRLLQTAKIKIDKRTGKKRLEIKDEKFTKEITDFTKEAFHITRVLNAPYNTPSTVEELIKLIQAKYKIDNSDIINDLNPLIVLGKNTINEYEEIYINTPQHKILEQYHSIGDDLMAEYYAGEQLVPTLQNFEALSKMIILQSLYQVSGNEGLITEEYLDSQTDIVTKLINSKNNNKFLSRLEIKEGGEISLDERTSQKDLTQKDLEFLRSSFDRLTDEQKIALAVVAYKQFGTKTSAWGGNWITFLDLKTSKKINANNNKAVKLLSETDWVNNIGLAIEASLKLDLSTKEAESYVFWLGFEERKEREEEKKKTVSSSKLRGSNTGSLQDQATKRIEEVIPPSAKKHLEKERVKTRIATQFIGDGVENSSTDKFREMYEKLYFEKLRQGVANTGKYTAKDIIYVSSNGRRKNRVDPVINGELQGVYKNIDKAIKAGATIVMDTLEYLKKTKSYNIGEAALAKYLESKGYSRVGETGEWKPGTKQTTQETAQEKTKTFTASELIADQKLKLIASTMKELNPLVKERGTHSANEPAIATDNKGSINVTINPRTISADFVNNKTDGITFDTASDYGKYSIEKAKLEAEGMEEAAAKKAALKNINYKDRSGNKGATYSLLRASILDSQSDQIKIAEQLESEGADRIDIYEATGLYRWGVDGNWRYEIDSSKAKLTLNDNWFTNKFLKIGLDPNNAKILLSQRNPLPLKDVLDYPELYKIMPEIADLKVSFISSDTLPGSEAVGSFNRRTFQEKLIESEYDILIAVNRSEQELLGTLLHEIQHGIQHLSDTQSGTNIQKQQNIQKRKTRVRIDMLANKLIDKYGDEDNRNDYYNTTELAQFDIIVNMGDNADIIGDSLFKEYEQQLRVYDSYGNNLYLNEKAREGYYSNPGEIEARIAQLRVGMSKRQKQKEYPWETAATQLRDMGLLKTGITLDEYLESNKTLEDNRYELMMKHEASDASISVEKDARLELKEHEALNSSFSVEQVSPPKLIKAFKKAGINIPEQGSRLHYNTIHNAFMMKHRDTMMSLPKFPSSEPYYESSAQKASDVIKSIPSDISSLPGEIQAFIYKNYDKLGPEILPSLSSIESQNYLEAVDLIFDIKNKNDLHYDLIDSLVEYNAYIETISNVSEDKAPSIFLQTTRQNYGINEYEAMEYLVSSMADLELEGFDLSLNDIIGTPGRQYLAVEKIKESENFELLGKVKKAIRLVNGVPTKFGLNNGTIEQVKQPTEISYSLAYFPKLLDTASTMMPADRKYSTQEMRDALLFGTRQSKEIIRLGRMFARKLLRDTGSEVAIVDGKKIKRTAESDRRGKQLREALSIFLEHFDPKNPDNDSWRDVPVIEKDKAIAALETMGQDETFQEIAAKEFNTVGEIFDSWTFWTYKNAPHLLNVTNPLKLYSELNDILESQYNNLTNTSSYIGELWFAKRSNYVPHFYERQAQKYESKNQRERAKQEQGRKYNTYNDAWNEAGLIPETLDFGDLINKYSFETASVARNRLSVSAMAQVSDEDMLPMMLVEGIETMGVLTNEAAHVIANRLEKGMSFLKPDFKFKTPRNISGFERLSLMTKEINPAELGYEVIDTQYKSLKTVWVKKGEPKQLMNHIFADQKEFSHPFAEKAFQSMLAINHTAKAFSIGLSLFHPFALIESLIAIDGLQGLDMKNRYPVNHFFDPFRTFKKLKEEYNKTIGKPDYATEWVNAGLNFDLGKSADIDYAQVNEGLLNLGKRMERSSVLPFVGLGKGFKGIAKLKWGADRLLWEVMLPAMKMYSANRLFAVEFARQEKLTGTGTVNVQKLREDISAYVNDAFGGQEWEQYLWANPRTRKWLHLFMFAPDWTLSALNISGVTHISPIQKALGSPTSELHARNRLTRYWGAFAAIVLLGIPNLFQAIIYGVAKATGDDDDELAWNTFGNEVGHRLQVDITPITDALGQKYGKTRQRRIYLAWGKQAYEVFGSKGWLRDPVGTATGKSSIAVKTVLEQGFGIVKPGWNVAWADHGFLESLMGVDGNFWDGRVSAIVKKFVPLSLMPVIDGMADPFKAKPTAFFAPTKLGMNSYTATREIGSVMRIYAEGGMKANFKGIVNKAKLEDLVSEIVDAAEKNGYDPKTIFSQGVSSARSFYYAKFFNAMEKNDESKMIEMAGYLQRLEASRKQFAQSVERRLDTQGKKFDGEARVKFNKAWFGAFKKAAQTNKRS